MVRSDWCLWIRAREIGAYGSMLDRVFPDRSCGSMLDRVFPDRSCGSMLVTEMVWIRLRGRVNLCSEMGIKMGREMGIERERENNKSEKMGRERACI